MSPAVRNGKPNPAIAATAKAIAKRLAPGIVNVTQVEAERLAKHHPELGNQDVVTAALFYELVVDRLETELYAAGRDLVDAAIDSDIDGKRGVALRAFNSIGRLVGGSRSGIQFAFGRPRPIKK